MRKYCFQIALFCIIQLLCGTVLQAQNVSETKCGEVVETEISSTENVVYSMNISSGETLILQVEPKDTYSDAYLTLVLNSPSNEQLERTSGTPVGFSTDELPNSGIYKISLFADRGGGTYTLYLGCGDIRPGDFQSEAHSSTEANVSEPSLTSFSGFGFPGLASIDFSTGIEIPLQLEQSQTVPIGGDIALYTYKANAAETHNLRLTRLSGNISLGITVIKKDTNEIIFFGGMPSSDNLSVDLSFPSEGIYVIGLFRLDTVEHSGTSGAIQIAIQ